MTALILIAIDLVAMAPSCSACTSHGTAARTWSQLPGSECRCPRRHDHPRELDRECGPWPRPLRCSLDHPTAFGSDLADGNRLLLRVAGSRPADGHVFGGDPLLGD